MKAPHIDNEKFILDGFAGRENFDTLLQRELLKAGFYKLRDPIITDNNTRIIATDHSGGVMTIDLPFNPKDRNASLIATINFTGDAFNVKIAGLIENLRKAFPKEPLKPKEELILAGCAGRADFLDLLVTELRNVGIEDFPSTLVKRDDSATIFVDKMRIDLPTNKANRNASLTATIHFPEGFHNDQMVTLMENLRKRFTKEPPRTANEELPKSQPVREPGPTWVRGANQSTQATPTPPAKPTPPPKPPKFTR